MPTITDFTITANEEEFAADRVSDFASGEVTSAVPDAWRATTEGDTFRALRNINIFQEMVTTDSGNELFRIFFNNTLIAQSEFTITSITIDWGVTEDISWSFSISERIVNHTVTSGIPFNPFSPGEEMFASGSNLSFRPRAIVTTGSGILKITVSISVGGGPPISNYDINLPDDLTLAGRPDFYVTSGGRNFPRGQVQQFATGNIPYDIVLGTFAG